MSSAIGAPNAPESGWKAQRWALMPVALLTTSLVGLFVLARIAIDDPGFSLESDYYGKAVHWDQQQAQWAQNARLDFKIELETEPNFRGGHVRVRALEQGGAPLTGARVTAEAFANSRASERQTPAFAETSPGVYEATLTPGRPGLWEFRFSVTRGSDRFTHVTRAEMAFPEHKP